MITYQAVIDEARSWVGVPFHHQGRSRNGIDCVGLLVAIRQALGMPVEDRSDYGRQPSRGELGRELAAQLIEIPVRRPLVLQPADILEFAIGGDPQHVGIYIERGTIIHALSGRKGSPNCVAEHRFLAPWPSRVRAHYRFPEFA